MKSLILVSLLVFSFFTNANTRDCISKSEAVELGAQAFIDEYTVQKPHLIFPTDMFWYLSENNYGEDIDGAREAFFTDMYRFQDGHVFYTAGNSSAFHQNWYEVKVSCDGEIKAQLFTED